jgi:hypothetical protein
MEKLLFKKANQEWSNLSKNVFDRILNNINDNNEKEMGIIYNPKTLSHSCLSSGATIVNSSIVSYDIKINLDLNKLNDISETTNNIKPLNIIDCNEQIVKKYTEGQYLAISHCWNDLIKNKDKDYNLFESQNLKKKWSIIVAKLLGFNLIWMDQYCIDQNDGDIKLKEISKMGFIYNNAAAVLCVLPCFLSKSFQYGKSNLDNIFNLLNKCNCEKGIKCRTYSFDDKYTSLDSIFDTSWNSRAWTLQEAVCSRKLLILTGDGYVYNITEILNDIANYINTNTECIYSKIIENTKIGSLAKLRDSYINNKKINWIDIQKQMSNRMATFGIDRIKCIGHILKVNHNKLESNKIDEIRYQICSLLIKRNDYTILLDIPNAWSSGSQSALPGFTYNSKPLLIKNVKIDQTNIQINNNGLKIKGYIIGYINEIIIESEPFENQKIFNTNNKYIISSIKKALEQACLCNLCYYIIKNIKHFINNSTYNVDDFCDSVKTVYDQIQQNRACKTTIAKIKLVNNLKNDQYIIKLINKLQNNQYINIILGNCSVGDNIFCLSDQSGELKVMYTLIQKKEKWYKTGILFTKFDKNYYEEQKIVIR